MVVAGSLPVMLNPSRHRTHSYFPRAKHAIEDQRARHLSLEINFPVALPLSGYHLSRNRFQENKNDIEVESFRRVDFIALASILYWDILCKNRLFLFGCESLPGLFVLFYFGDDSSVTFLPNYFC